MKVSIVIPIFNAENLLAESVTQLRATLSHLGVDYEILLRDDGSRDKSAEIMRGLSQKTEEVRCFFNQKNLGLGATLRALWQDAAGDVVVYLDVDLPFGADAILPLVRDMAQADIAVASRYRGQKNSVPFLRRISSYCYYLFCRALFRIRVRDIGSGTVAMKKDVLRSLACSAPGFVIHIELLVKAQRAGLIVQEVPLPSRATPPGTFSIFKHGFAVIKGTWQLYQEQQGRRQGV